MKVKDYVVDELNKWEYKGYEYFTKVDEDIKDTIIVRLRDSQMKYLSHESFDLDITEVTSVKLEQVLEICRMTLRGMRCYQQN